jgi:hypothetical protein
MADSPIPNSPHREFEKPATIQDKPSNSTREIKAGPTTDLKHPGSSQIDTGSGKGKKNMHQWSVWASANTSVLVSIAAAVFSFGSCYGSNQSASIAREALTSVQRAFVSLKTIESVGVPNAQGQIIEWRFFPRWENSGNTQTRTMRLQANAAWPIEPLPDDFDFHDAGKVHNPPYFLAARSKTLSGPLVISPEVIAQVRNGERRLYFWGWVAYRDVFEESEPHLTEFCNELTITDGDVSTGQGIQFLHVSCPSHNCTDEDCADYGSVEKKLRGEFNAK